MSLDKLKKALEGIDIDFDINDFMPKADFNTAVEGYKQEIEDTKVKSQKVGQEILLKELKNDLGFDYDGRKDPANLKKAYIEKFGKSDTPNEDVEALRNTFTKELEAKNLEIDSIKTSYKKESDDKAIMSSLKKSFSAFADKTNYKPEDLADLARARGEFAVIDGNVFQSKDGEVMKNDLLQGVTVDAFASQMMTDGGYIKQATGGKIVGDQTKGGKYSMEQFMAAENDKGSTAIQFAENMAAAQAAGTLDV